jgi:hypothetical protein
MFAALEQAAIVALAGIIGEWGPRLTLTVLRDRSSPRAIRKLIVQISVSELPTIRELACQYHKPVCREQSVNPEALVPDGRHTSEMAQAGEYCPHINLLRDLQSRGLPLSSGIKNNVAKMSRK